MRVPARMRAGRLAARLACGALLLTATVPAAACGSVSSQVQVTLTSSIDANAGVKADELPRFVMQVVNNGPGQVSGLTLRAELPADFHYQATTAVEANRDLVARTSPDDPAANTATPTWGAWSLAPPQKLADGTVEKAQLKISFSAKAAGKPGNYGLVVHVVDDGGTDNASNPLAVNMVPSPRYAISGDASPTLVSRESDVTFRVIVVNSGTGNGNDVAVLVTLPPGLSFSRVQGYAGNAARARGNDPVSGTLIPDFQFFTIPPLDGGGHPGQLVVTFVAHIAAAAAAGHLSLAVQLADHEGTVLSKTDLAAIQLG